MAFGPELLPSTFRWSVFGVCILFIAVSGFELFRHRWLRSTPGRSTQVRTIGDSPDQSAIIEALKRNPDRLRRIAELANPPALTPVPDMTIHDLFFHIRSDVVDVEDLYEVVGNDVRDRFSTGQLDVWGREIDPHTKFQSALSRIPMEYWPKAAFTYAFLDDGAEMRPHCWTPTRLGPIRNDYADLRVNRAQVLIIWPKTKIDLSKPRQVSRVLDWKFPVEALNCFANPELVAARAAIEARIAEAHERAREPEERLQQWHNETSGGEIKRDQANVYYHWHELLSKAADDWRTGERDLERNGDDLRADFIVQLEHGRLVAKGFGYPDDHDGERQIEPSRWRNLFINYSANTANRRHDGSVAFTELLIARPDEGEKDEKTTRD